MPLSDRGRVLIIRAWTEGFPEGPGLRARIISDVGGGDPTLDRATTSVETVLYAVRAWLQTVMTETPSSGQDEGPTYPARHV